MTQQELDAIPQMGIFDMVLIPGSNPACYRPVRRPVYVLKGVNYYVGSDGNGWAVGWHDGQLWKVKA